MYHLRPRKRKQTLISNWLLTGEKAIKQTEEKKKLKEEEYDCMICIDSTSPCDRVQMYRCCKKYFHFDCLEKWVWRNGHRAPAEKYCPHCRKEMKDPLQIVESNQWSDDVFFTRDVKSHWKDNYFSFKYDYLYPDKPTVDTLILGFWGLWHGDKCCCKTNRTNKTLIDLTCTKPLGQKVFLGRIKDHVIPRIKQFWIDNDIRF